MRVGISGASGSIYGYRLLQKLRRRPEVEVHLILTRSAERTAFLENGWSSQAFKALADFTYSIEDIGSRLASGSFPTGGMVIAPCSVHSMSAIAAGLSSNLLVRAVGRVPKRTSQTDSHGARDPAAFRTLKKHADAH